MSHDPEISLDLLINDSMGWTPIQIKTIINEALIHAHQQGRDFLTYKDWLSAADERTLGLQQPIRAWNVVDRRKTAYHEAGHAVAARYLQPENRISKASIIRRGHALGYVQQQPREERTSLYARSIETSIMVSLAGHVIESRFLDSLTTGPSSDLESATAWAEAYVGSYAMGPTKLILPVVNSAAPAGPVLIGAHELLDQLYEETDRLLHEKEPAIHYLARALIEHGELIGDELEAVFNEIETTYPYLRRPFERKVLQFRPFGRDMRPEETPREPEAEEEAAAADAPAADGRTRTGVATWQPPRPPGVASGSSRGPSSGRSQTPGVPTDAVPPWALR
jgi:cell division protease FtsH